VQLLLVLRQRVAGHGVHFPVAYTNTNIFKTVRDNDKNIEQISFKFTLSSSCLY
jgi:hypothetical protein